MSYIKIHEVDKTIQDLAPITSDNIAYIPINSTDGPIGRYTVLQSYDDFVRIYGTDPNPNSPVLTSWEYAANLLLRKMPVMVRRIGCKVDDDGIDTAELLTGAETAKGILKLEVPSTAETIYDKSTSATQTTVSDPVTVTLTEDGGAASQNEGDMVIFTRMVGSDAKTLIVTDIDSTSDNRKTNKYTLSDAIFSDDIQKLSITAAAGSTLKIHTLTIGNSHIFVNKLDADMGAVHYMVNINNCEVKDASGQVVSPATLEDYIKSEALVLPAEYTITFNNIGADASYELEFNGDVEIKAYAEADAQDHRLIRFYSDLASLPYIVDVKYPEKGTDDPDNMSEFDANGLLNIFKLEYKYPGINGNRISAGIRFVNLDGIYLQVWNGTQRLENIKLVNQRYRNDAGRYASYDINSNKDTLWQMLLDNFDLIDTDGSVKGVDLQTPLETDYITVSLNTNIDVTNADYILCFQNKTGAVKYALTGGSNPDDTCVLHEVYKTYKPLTDKYLYDIKFITNGAYCDYLKEGTEGALSAELYRRNIEYSMINLAEGRGDCLAFLDIPLDYPQSDVLDYFQDISTSYATAYAPWVKVNLLTRSTKWCPPSFVALWTIAKSVSRGNKVYAPPAGVNRAHLSEAEDLMFQIPSDYIDEWQDNHVQFINPIVYINGYGINIFGQRTLYSRVDGSYETNSALQYLNTRLVANEIKKKIFKTCIELTFEYNNLHTWLAFKSKMAKLLDVMLYDHSITYYNMVMDESTMTDSDIQTNHIVGTVSVAISTTAEKFDITFELLPNQVNFLNLDYSVDNSTASTTYGELQ